MNAAAAMAFNRCVNCTITFDKPRVKSQAVLALDSPLRDLLFTWISTEVVSEHRICAECVVVLQSQALLREPSRGYGHQAVCLGCGETVLRTRSIAINRSIQQYTVMQSWVPQIQPDLPIFTRVCIQCWQRATRVQTLNLKNIKQEVEHKSDVHIQMADESSVEDVVTVKKEDVSDSLWMSENLGLTNEDNCVPNEEYSDVSIKIEEEPLAEAVSEAHHRRAATSCTAVAKHEIEIKSCIKSEIITFGCTICFQDFVHETAYNNHMIMHLQDAGGDAACDASQVCEPRAAVSRSGDSLVLQNKTGSPRLYDDDPSLSADCAQTTVAPLSARLAANNETKVQITESTGAFQKSEQILKAKSELDKSSHSDTKLLCDTFRNPKKAVQKPKKAVLDENSCMRTHTAAKPYSCEVYNYKCPRNSDVSHTRTHTAENTFSREICSNECSQKNNLLQYTKTFTCEICRYKCSFKSRLLQHMMTHTGEKPYSCKMCNYKCSRKNSLLRHIKSHTGEKPFTCEICKNNFSSKSHLLEHIATHTGEKRYSCKTCNYKFSRQNNLLRHIRTHTGEKPYSCKLCNYKCSQQNSLLEHMNTHTGVKPYSCELCSYNCSQKRSLLWHMKSHSDKAFSCKICNNKFPQKSRLLRHMKTHTGENPYSCDRCNYKCTRKSNLLRHMKTHTGEDDIRVCMASCIVSSPEH